MSRKNTSTYDVHESTNPNPITKLREAEGLTQRELARHLQITEQAVRRAEQGTFAHPPRTIQDWYSQIKPLDSSLVHVYNEWRLRKRASVGQYQPLLNPLAHSVGSHPMRNLRYDMMEEFAAVTGKDINRESLVGFCKLVCLEPKVVSGFETSYVEEVPPEILKMMEEINYRWIDSFTEALNQRRSVWLEGIRGRSR